MQQYLTFEPKDNILIIKLTDEGKREFAELSTDDNLTSEDILVRLMEYQLCNGYHLVEPKTIGALTESLIIADEIVDEETTEADFNATNFWWFPNYQIISYTEELDLDGLFFTKC